MAGNRKIQVELIPDMYEIGLFKNTLSSRKRLRVTTICVIAALFLLFFGVGSFIRYVSVWDYINVPLIILLFIACIVAGYFLALAIGDAFFAGPWREKMYHGSKFMPENVDDQAALLKNKSIYFVIFWGLAIAILGVAGDFCTGGNIHWYQKTGSIVISMRSEDPSERLNVLKSVSNAFHSAKWENEEIRGHITELTLDSDQDVRAWAAYISGRALIADAAENLINVFKDKQNSPYVRSEAAIALGRLEWKSSRAAMLSTLRLQFEENPADTELVPAILFALYSMNDPIAVQFTMQMLDTCQASKTCSSEILQYAFFYLKSLRAKDSAALSFRYLSDESITDEMRCYAADCLRWTASKKDVPELKAQFEKAPVNLECPVIFRKYHEEPGIIFFERYMMRALLLKSVANINDNANYDWIWMIGSNPQENMQTRKVAEVETRRILDSQKNK